MSSTTTVPSKTSKTTVSKKMKTATTSTAPRRWSLNQATRAHHGKRKTTKTFSNDKPQALTGLLGLSTCNSGFLNSLLADVAKAKQDILRGRASDSTESPPSPKRRRISMPNSANSSPVQQLNKPLLEPSSFLDLLWEESWLKPPMVARRLEPRPPQEATLIPATVSETFTPEEEPKASSAPVDAEDGFGWYVDMDDDDDYYSCDDSHRFGSSPYASKASTGSLAFSAPTAPKASNHDAEVAWAKAADTVDDVLGGLF